MTMTMTMMTMTIMTMTMTMMTMTMTMTMTATVKLCANYVKNLCIYLQNSKKYLSTTSVKI